LHIWNDREFSFKHSVSGSGLLGFTDLVLLSALAAGFMGKIFLLNEHFKSILLLMMPLPSVVMDFVEGQVAHCFTA